MSNKEMSQNMIENLVEELTPVKPMKNRDGLALTLLVAAVCAAAIVGFSGMRDEVMHPMFFLRGGALLLLGLTSSYAVISMSQPAVGNSFKGWIWALMAALLFPLTAIIMAMFAAPDDMAILVPREGLICLAVSLLTATGIGGAQVLWLRKGAPAALNRAGWLVGMSSGALGAAAFSLHCPFNSIFYVGLWYTLAVVISAGLGRMIVPRLIRW